MCQVHTFIIDIGVVVGFLSMSSIALDRYLLISREYPRYLALQTHRNAGRGIAAVWAVALAIAVTEIAVWNGVDWPEADGMVRRCYSPPRNHPAFALSVFVATFLVPIVLIVGLSLRFLVLLRRRLARAPSSGQARPQGGASSQPGASSSSSSQRETPMADVGDSKASLSHESLGDGVDGTTRAAPASPSTARRERMRRRYVRPAVIMASLVAAFLVCTLPYMLYISLAIRLCPDCDDQRVRFHLTNVLFLNSCVNPFLYAATHPKIRAFHARVFRATLGRLCRLRRS